MTENLNNRRAEIIAFTVMAIALPLLIYLHLLPALLAGLLVHELVHAMAPRLFGLKNLGLSRILALSALLAVIIAAVSALIVAAIVFFRSDAGSLANLLESLAGIVERTRSTLPISMQEWLPVDGANLKSQIVDWLRGHAVEIQSAGGAFGHALIVSFVGMIVGAMISLKEASSDERPRLLARSFTNAFALLGDSFRRVAFAQVRISALNTILTSAYLVVLLPLVGIQLPLIKTMILVTFVAGLLPVLGNLISNSVIVIISLSYSLPAAIGSLVFLVVIHKLEYFINARIVGSKIHAAAYELLCAMLVMEAMFGVPGVVAAPIYYAYFKTEFTNRGWI